MKKTILVYKSKYGASEKYANILSRKLGCDSFDLKKIKKVDLSKYDNIVLFGGLYAGGILGREFIEDNIHNLYNKKVAIFAVGASPYSEEVIEEVRRNGANSKLKDLPIFYGRGGWDFDKMSFTDKMLIRALRFALSRKQDKLENDPWAKDFIENNEGVHDWVEEKYLEPLIEFLGE